MIGEATGQSWLRTDPYEYSARVSRRDVEMSGALILMVLMCRAWNKASGHLLAGFHAETLVLNHFASYSKRFSLPSMMAGFFDELAGYVANPCVDPTSGNRIDEYLDDGAPSKRALVLARAQQTAAVARKAYALESVSAEQALAEWSTIFGASFSTGPLSNIGEAEEGLIE